MGHPIREWVIEKTLKHPKRTIVVSLFLTIMMASGAQYFVIDDDMMKMLPKNMPSRVAWDNVMEEFGNTDMVYVTFGIRDEKGINPKMLSSLWDFTRALEDMPEVEKVTSITTTERLDSEDGFMEVSDLQYTRDLYPEEVEDIQNYLDNNENIKKQLLSRNEDYLNVVIQPVKKAPFDVLSHNVKNLGNELLSDYETQYGGAAYITGMVPGLIRDDVAMLMRAGMLIMVLILLVNLRSVAGVGMVLMTIVLSLVFMLGFMGWVYRLTGSEKFLFTMMNTSMPIILLTIANSDGVHMIAKFFKELRKRRNTQEAVRVAMDSLLIPIFLTSITTSAAFLAMVFAPIEQMIGYGISISAGILWAWILSSTMLPALISLKKWKMDSKAVTHASIFEKGIDILAKQVAKHPKYILTAGLFLVSIGGFGVTMVEVDVNFSSFFKKGTELRDGMDFMEEEMSGTMDVRVRVEGDIKDPENLQSLIELQNYMEEEPKVGMSFSIANMVQQMHKTIMDDDPKYETIPDTRGKVNNLFTMYSFSGDPDAFESLVDYDYEVGLVTAMSKTLHTNEILTFVKGIESYVIESFPEGLSAMVTGMAVVFRDLVFLIVKSSLISIIVSIFVIGGIASLFFRKLHWGFLAVVPLTAAVILNFGFMGIFDVKLSHITAILASIIIGVGVDFAIHYIAQFRRYSRDRSKYDNLSRKVIDDVGYPIVLDAASNMGFGALLFSAFVPIQYIGGLMVFAMVSTSLGTLTVLAAMTELLKKKIIEQ
ncbi:MAG: MMPL family transporter [Candidatus Marinimicrobia bacterium]|nr:MMPL family transporter [Candidatus Neomarinimicrobiota bacterium]